MPAGWFNFSVRFIIPIILFALFVWNLVTLFRSGGIYGSGDGYSLAANLIGGWLLIVLSLCSGFIVKAIVKSREKKGFREDDRSWDELGD